MTDRKEQPSWFHLTPASPVGDSFEGKGGDGHEGIVGGKVGGVGGLGSPVGKVERLGCS